jgi:hypothetical protein
MGNFRLISPPQNKIERPGILEWSRDWLTSQGYVRDPYRTDDYCEFLQQIVSDSPVASTAVLRRQQFIAGRGFDNQAVGKKRVNKKQTLAQLHSLIMDDYGLFERFALRIIPTRGGKIKSIEHIPVEWVRYAFPDENNVIHGCYVIPWINTRERDNQPFEYLPIWEPGEMTNGRIKADIDGVAEFYEKQFQTHKKGPREGYSGHIFFHNRTRPGSRLYSRARIMSAQYDIISDTRTSEAFDRISANAFQLGGILVVPGDPNEPASTDPGTRKPMTKGEELEMQLEAQAGSENAGTVMVIWQGADDSAPQYVPFQVGNLHESTEVTTRLIRERISIAAEIPEILLGISTPGRLGNTQEIRNAIKFANANTEPYRIEIEEFYQSLLKDVFGINFRNIKINPLQDISDLPDPIFAALTQRQKDQYLDENFGIEPDPEGAENTDLTPPENGQPDNQK